MRLRYYLAAMETDQQRARIPKGVLALLDVNHLVMAERQEEESAGQEGEKEEE